MGEAGREISLVDISVVVPVKDEADNVLPLIREISAALDGVCRFEIVYVDDGSTDGTVARLAEAKAEFPMLRIVRHDGCFGQSQAIQTGVRHAAAPLIATLDGDGQNDPADIPALLKRFGEEGGSADALLMIAGWRAKRKDTWLKRISSKVANAVRGTLLGDATPDTGCGLKVFPRTMFLAFPGFDHMHRFMPALTIRAGGRVVSVQVNHRPRERGTSKYGLFNRLWVGIVDLIGVMWLNRRPNRVRVVADDGQETQ
ncbi:MAG: glycosyltransferase family 2 protein [Rhodospirillales bacterium]|nr:glycosyltransferase family 2 protein [Rhodospirillales bacterium]